MGDGRSSSNGDGLRSVQSTKFCESSVLLLLHLGFDYKFNQNPKKMNRVSIKSQKSYYSINLIKIKNKSIMKTY